jgi:hypothetical protein
METAVIIYHKNAMKKYKHNWIIKCLESIQKQTFQSFDIYELAYGENEKSLVKKFNRLHDYQNILNKHYFFNQIFENHIYAMNFLLNKIFDKNNTYKYCFNINIDDYYNINRFQEQIDFIKEFNVDLVSSQMIYIDENNNIIKHIDYLAYKKFNSYALNGIIKENVYIADNLKKNHNIISHPSVCYTKKFWKLIGPYDNCIPLEDLILFKKASQNSNIKIHILKNFLLYYRIHNNQICKKI